MKDFIFKGVATALVTPFRNGKICYTTFERLIIRQIKAGVSALVFFGTTGESACLSDREKLEIMRFARSFVGQRCKILFGIGSNNAKTAESNAKIAEKFGADGLLAVTPYYNKCNQKGLFQYYQSICSATALPVVAYSVPARTGVDILPETMKKLAELPNLTGVKDAKGDLVRATELLYLSEGKYAYYSGDDFLNFPLYCLGAHGSISVLSNLFPASCVEVYNLVQSGKLIEGAELSKKLFPLVKACFSDINPIPIKAALSQLGFPVGEPRLPLTGLDRKKRQALQAALRAFQAEVEKQ